MESRNQKITIQSSKFSILAVLVNDPLQHPLENIDLCEVFFKSKGF